MGKFQFCRPTTAISVAFLYAFLLFPIQGISGFFDSAAEENAKNTCWSMYTALNFHLDKSGRPSDWADYRISAEDDWGQDLVWVQFMPKIPGSWYGYSCFTKKSGVGISIRVYQPSASESTTLYCLDAGRNELYQGKDTCLSN